LAVLGMHHKRRTGPIPGLLPERWSRWSRRAGAQNASGSGNCLRPRSGGSDVASGIALSGVGQSGAVSVGAGASVVWPQSGSRACGSDNAMRRPLNECEVWNSLTILIRHDAGSPSDDAIVLWLLLWDPSRFPIGHGCGARRWARIRLLQAAFRLAAPHARKALMRCGAVFFRIPLTLSSRANLPVFSEFAARKNQVRMDVAFVAAGVGGA